MVETIEPNDAAVHQKCLNQSDFRDVSVPNVGVDDTQTSIENKDAPAGLLVAGPNLVRPLPVWKSFRQSSKIGEEFLSEHVFDESIRKSREAICQSFTFTSNYD